jgi:hypothetical protein
LRRRRTPKPRSCASVKPQRFLLRFRGRDCVRDPHHAACLSLLPFIAHALRPPQDGAGTSLCACKLTRGASRISSVIVLSNSPDPAIQGVLSLCPVLPRRALLFKAARFRTAFVQLRAVRGPSARL